MGEALDEGGDDDAEARGHPGLRRHFLATCNHQKIWKMDATTQLVTNTCLSLRLPEHAPHNRRREWAMVNVKSPPIRETSVPPRTG